MLYDGTAATAIHTYSRHVDPMYVRKFTRLSIDRIDINFMDISISYQVSCGRLVITVNL